MANKENKTNIKDERIEDVTQYGEFIASFDQWSTLDRQRAVAKKLETVTNTKSGCAADSAVNPNGQEGCKVSSEAEPDSGEE